MALANFFDKAALGASQILQGFSFDVFRSTLNGHTIGVAFDDAVQSSEGAISLELALNLLARLYPKIVIRPLSASGGPQIERLITLTKNINPDIELVDAAEDATCWLIFGTTALPDDCPTFYLGSDGWIALLSKEQPVGSGTSGNPFGAAAAACFGVANIFRYVFGAQLFHSELDDTLRMSLFDYQQGAAVANPVFNLSDLGEAYLVGAGAIGNAFLWSLAKAEGLSGTLHVIDKEVIDLSNLQRYVLSEQEAVSVSKATLAETALKDSQIQVIPYRQTWGEFLISQPRFVFARVAVALDSAKDRIAVQASLPRWIVNAWTQSANLGVSRHSFLGDKACLACLYMPDKQVASESERIAEEIGLPDAEREVRTILARGLPVQRELLERIAQAKKIDVTNLLQFEGGSLRKFYSEAICGGLVLRLAGEATSAQAAQVPMSFQSALAGVMLAAELVKHASSQEQEARTRTEIDLLRKLGTHLSHNQRKNSSGRCICHDSDYQDAYTEKYSLSESS